MAKIYVSSTFLDLQDCRRQVSLVVRKMGHEDVAMEYYIAEDKRPVDRCLEDVSNCNLYVGVFAWRYGWIPKKKNPKKLSITELEYRQAIKNKKTCLIFLLDEKALWSPAFIDDDKKRMRKLRDRLSEEHGAAMFTSADNIGSVVAPAIHDWMKKSGLLVASVPITELSLEKYYTALRKRYGVLALEGLTPPQKEEYLQIQLRSVFVEQNVRENPPPVELPKEVWEKLQRDNDIHPEDLPSGVTLDDVRKAREEYFGKPLRPVLDILIDARHQYAIILGDPGSGKSTLARFVMLSLIDPSTSDDKLQKAFSGYLPLLIELWSYAGLCTKGNCASFLEFLEYLGKTEGWALTQSALHNYLKNDGRAVIIFDGLDEIFDSEQREHLTHQIVGFCGDYPKARVIVTSRVIGYRRKILTDAGFIHFTLQDLDEKQVETFVSCWYDLAMSDRLEEAKERKERILKSFKDSSSIRQLAGNPMLLTIMAIIGKHQELPRERWKLYDHAAGVLIQHWDVNKHLKDESIEADFIGEDDKKELLRRLAFIMQNGDVGRAGNYIHRERLQTEFEGYFKERYSQTSDRAKLIAEKMIGQFRERSFILSLYGANLYGFVHRAFLEYFCASAIVWKFEKTKELSIEQLKTDVYGKHWKNQSWQEVLRLICGMINEKWAGEIITWLIIGRDSSMVGKFDKTIFAKITISIQCLSELRNPTQVVDPARLLLEQTCSLFDSIFVGQSTYWTQIQKQLLPAIIKIGPNWPGKEFLLEWMRNHPPFAKAWFKGIIFGTFIGSVCKEMDQVHDVILDYAKSELSERRILVPFVLSVGWPEDIDTFSTILNLAEKDSDGWVRAFAIHNLSEHFRGSHRVADIIKDHARNDLDAFVRSSAMGSLVRWFKDDPDTLHLLRERIFDDPDEHAREGALALVRLFFSKHEDTFSLLCERSSEDPSPTVRGQALRGLENSFRDKQATLSIIQQRAMKDDSPQANSSKLSKERRWFVREIAINALAKYWFNHPDTLVILSDRAENDPTPWLRERAKELIKEITSKNKKSGK